jgi:RNA polymerase sigma-70 factor (ECF subfamily)
VAAPSADAAFRAATEPHRRELLVHCYRMLGSADDAQDVVQEAMTRAWRAWDRYDEQRASVRTWLHRITTNACLDALASRRRRPLPSDVGPLFDDPEAPFSPGADVPWLQPLPDAVLGPPPADPAEVAVERSRLRLAVVAALQLLPPRQRAALVLREVLALPAKDVAKLLGTTPAGVNSALQRARATIAAADVDLATGAEPPDEQRAAVEAWMAAFEAADVAALTDLVRDDVVLEMPPMWNWYRGADDYGAFMARVFRTRGTRWRTVPVRANRQVAAAAYVAADGGWTLHTVQLLGVDGGLISRVTVFQDPVVFDLFELPVRLPR